MTVCYFFTSEQLTLCKYFFFQLSYSIVLLLFFFFHFKYLSEALLHQKVIIIYRCDYVII